MFRQYDMVAGNPHKQAVFQQKQERLKEEVAELLKRGNLKEAVNHYQQKTGCPHDKALTYCTQLRRERFDILVNKKFPRR